MSAHEGGSHRHPGPHPPPLSNAELPSPSTSSVDLSPGIKQDSHTMSGFGRNGDSAFPLTSPLPIPNRNQHHKHIKDPHAQIVGLGSWQFGSSSPPPFASLASPSHAIDTHGLIKDGQVFETTPTSSTPSSSPSRFLAPPNNSPCSPSPMIPHYLGLPPPVPVTAKNQPPIYINAKWGPSTSPTYAGSHHLQNVYHQNRKQFQYHPYITKRPGSPSRLHSNSIHYPIDQGELNGGSTSVEKVQTVQELSSLLSEMSTKDMGPPPPGPLPSPVLGTTQTLPVSPFNSHAIAVSPSKPSPRKGAAQESITFGLGLRVGGPSAGLSPSRDSNVFNPSKPLMVPNAATLLKAFNPDPASQAPIVDVRKSPSQDTSKSSSPRRGNKIKGNPYAPAFVFRPPSEGDANEDSALMGPYGGAFWDEGCEGGFPYAECGISVEDYMAESLSNLVTEDKESKAEETGHVDTPRPLSPVPFFQIDAEDAILESNDLEDSDSNKMDSSTPEALATSLRKMHIQPDSRSPEITQSKSPMRRGSHHRTRSLPPIGASTSLSSPSAASSKLHSTLHGGVISTTSSTQSSLLGSYSRRRRCGTLAHRHEDQITTRAQQLVMDSDFTTGDMLGLSHFLGSQSKPYGHPKLAFLGSRAKTTRTVRPLQKCRWASIDEPTPSAVSPTGRGSGGSKPRSELEGGKEVSFMVSTAMRGEGWETQTTKTGAVYYTLPNALREERRRRRERWWAQLRLEEEQKGAGAEGDMETSKFDLSRQVGAELGEGMQEDTGGNGSAHKLVGGWECSPEMSVFMTLDDGGLMLMPKD
ncbi:hypothetical protein HDV05_003367 [Chytridiales sp. JEL 0842]|nr:hypothetical protein HDV05_003367 [Chytridiales sp. JEL 0842]